MWNRSRILTGLLYSNAAQRLMMMPEFMDPAPGPFTPLGSLSILSRQTFTVLEHPDFPQHSVRIKWSRICGGLVDAYTGYLDTESRHSFFWFFESKDRPEKDDFIFWTSGGSGGSSARAVFMETGPCRILDAGRARLHEESWNTHANVFFLDQPVSVGYSYSSQGDGLTPIETASEDVVALVSIFFEHFPAFKGLPFHLAGDNYASSYLPAFTTMFLDQNFLIEHKELDLSPINLSSLILGNPMADFYSMVPSYYKMVCTSYYGKLVLDATRCVEMKRTLPDCLNAAKRHCIDSPDPTSCQEASNECIDQQFHPFWLYARGRDPHDITMFCSENLDSCPTFALAPHVLDYLNHPQTREELRIDPVFEKLSWDSPTDDHFHRQLDLYHDTSHHITALLERGVRVLIYAGKHDFVCNWVASDEWAKNFEWHGGDDFRKQSLRNWVVNGTVTGLTRRSKDGTLAFVAVEGAGHSVPRDKPKELLRMIKRWMKREEL